MIDFTGFANTDFLYLFFIIILNEKVITSSHDKLHTAYYNLRREFRKTGIININETCLKRKLMGQLAMKVNT